MQRSDWYFIGAMICLSNAYWIGAVIAMLLLTMVFIFISLEDERKQKENEP